MFDLFFSRIAGPRAPYGIVQTGLATAMALTALLARPVEVERVAHLAELGDGKPRRYRCLM